MCGTSTCLFVLTDRDDATGDGLAAEFGANAGLTQPCDPELLCGLLAAASASLAAPA